MPAGVLTTVAVVFGLWGQLDPAGRLAVLLIGIGLMFLLLYVMRYDEHDARWASVPAGALLLLGVVTLVRALPLPDVIENWWPILIVIGGALLIILGIARRKTEPVATLPPAPAGFESLPPAPGAAVTTNLPAVDAKPSRPRSAPAPSGPAADSDVDIYALIKQQPPPPEKPSS